MNPENCVYFRGFLFQNSCAKGVDLEATWGQNKRSNLAHRVPCIGGEGRESCVLHPRPTEAELRGSEKKQAGESTGPG